MKKRIVAIISALIGVVAIVSGVLSAIHSVQGRPKPSRIGGVDLPYLVRYYDLRWELLLIALGAVLWLTALVLLLSPWKRRVAVSAEK